MVLSWSHPSSVSSLGYAAAIASFIPLRSSAQMIRISFTPRFSIHSVRKASILSAHSLQPEWSESPFDRLCWFQEWHKLPASESLHYLGQNNEWHRYRVQDKFPTACVSASPRPGAGFSATEKSPERLLSSGGFFPTYLHIYFFYLMSCSPVSAADTAYRLLIFPNRLFTTILFSFNEWTHGT